MNDSDSQRILFLSSDLVFASRVRAACIASGAEFYFGSDLPAAGTFPSDQVRFVILDLATRGCLVEELLPAANDAYPRAEVVAYAPHVHEELFQDAADCGYDNVLTRRQFDVWVSRLPELLQNPRD